MRVGWVTGLLLLQVATVGAQGASRSSAQPASDEAPVRPLPLDPAAAASTGPWGFSLAAYDGYDHIRALGDGTGSDVLRKSGARAGLTAHANAGVRRPRSAFSVSADSTSSYYAPSDDLFVDASVSSRQSTTVGRNLALSFSERAGYAPYQSLRLFPGLGIDTGADTNATEATRFSQSVARAHMLRYDLFGSATKPLSSRTQLTLDYQQNRSKAEGDLPDWASQEGGFRLRHQVARRLGVMAGYAYAATGGTRFHHLRLGFDDMQVQSRTRRTTLGVGLDATIVGANASTTRGRELRVLGYADLGQYFARTWSGRLTYRRDVTMVEAYDRPVYRDSIGGGVAGSVATRTEAGVNAAWVIADLQAGNGEGRDRARTASAWVQTTLTRRWGLFAQYTYYQHWFDGLVPIPGLTPQFARHSAHAGVMLLVSPRERRAVARPVAPVPDPGVTP